MANRGRQEDIDDLRSEYIYNIYIYIILYAVKCVCEKICVVIQALKLHCDYHNNNTQYAITLT